MLWGGSLGVHGGEPKEFEREHDEGSDEVYDEEYDEREYNEDQYNKDEYNQRQARLPGQWQGDVYNGWKLAFYALLSAVLLYLFCVFVLTGGHRSVDGT
jgi:hypothetical protein